MLAGAAKLYQAAHTRRVPRRVCTASGKVATEFQSDSSRTDSPVRILHAQPASPVSTVISGRASEIRADRAHSSHWAQSPCPDRATKASFRLSVSEGHFWCLVFGRCGCSVKNSNERSRPPLSGECRLKRLVAGVSGYIFDESVTKCVAVLKQHGGFAPTVPSRRSRAG